MANCKVSVIVPVYNAEKYLGRCVESICNQTLPEIEIILVDDGSKAACADVCDALAQADARVKVIHKQNAGAGLARNTGMEAATGEYIGFVDADDYIEPSMYETLYNAAKKHDADLVMSGVCFVGGNTFSQEGDRLEKSYFDTDTVFASDDLKTLLLGVVGALPHEADDSRYGVSVWKNLFRNSLQKEKNITFLSEREVMSEDTMFVVDYIKHCTRAVGIPGAFYCYCRNDDSFSKSYNSERFEKSLIFVQELEKHIMDTVDKQEYALYLDRLAQGYARVSCSQEIVHAKEENIPFSVLKKRLKEICGSEKIRTVLKTYPWYRLPIKQAAFAFAMKYRLFFLQKLMVLLRDR